MGRTLRHYASEYSDEEGLLPEPVTRRSRYSSRRQAGKSSRSFRNVGRYFRKSLPHLAVLMGALYVLMAAKYPDMISRIQQGTVPFANELHKAASSGSSFSTSRTPIAPASVGYGTQSKTQFGNQGIPPDTIVRSVMSDAQLTAPSKRHSFLPASVSKPETESLDTVVPHVEMASQKPETESLDTVVPHVEMASQKPETESLDTVVPHVEMASQISSYSSTSERKSSVAPNTGTSGIDKMTVKRLSFNRPPRRLSMPSVPQKKMKVTDIDQLDPEEGGENPVIRVKGRENALSGPDRESILREREQGESESAKSGAHPKPVEYEYSTSHNARTSSIGQLQKSAGSIGAVNGENSRQSEGSFGVTSVEALPGREERLTRESETSLKAETAKYSHQTQDTIVSEQPQSYEGESSGTEDLRERQTDATSKATPGDQGGVVGPSKNASSAEGTGEERPISDSGDGVGSDSGGEDLSGALEGSGG